ncbi:MAG: PAS domain S-box protein [SAR324 cluster bacterium]|nr:PAS domain S-box protein [SAR324 cluster bacterium]
MKLRGKLTLSFLSLALFTVALAILAIWTIGKIEKQFDEVINEGLPVIESLEELQLSSAILTDSSLEYALLQAELGHHKGKDPAYAAQKGRDQKNLEGYHNALAHFERTTAKHPAKFKEYHDKIKALGEKVIEYASELETIKHKGVHGLPVIEVMEKLEASELALEKELEETLKFEEEEINQAKTKLHHLIIWADESFLIFGILAFVGALAIGVIMGGKIAKPVMELAEATGDIAKTQFNVQVKVRSNDEVGELARSFNKMADHLAKTTVSRDYFASVLEAVSSSLVILDQEGKIKECNHATGYLLGYPSDELVGEPVDKLFDLAQFEGGTVDLEFMGSADRMETYYKNKEGEKLPVMVSAASISGDDGELSGYVLVAQNISSMIQLKRRLRNAMLILKKNNLLPSQKAAGKKS